MLRSRAFALSVLVMAGGLALAGCNGSTGGQSPPAGQNTASAHTMSFHSPLTGEVVKGPPPRHPVMVVKIDNSMDSAPQIGIGKADMVTEELVEGGITRLAVFYDSHVPKVVGPVRSMRASDIGIVEPAHAVLVASGGAPPTVRRMRAAHIKTFTDGAPGFYRVGQRPAPYNLFMHLPRLAKTMKHRGTPSPYLPFGSASSFPKGTKAAHIAAKFSAGHTTMWRYQAGHYVNTNSNAAAGSRYSPNTVLVCRVHVGNAGYLDPAGNPVPETDFTGTGKAMVFHGGRMVRATWVKKGFSKTVRLRTKAGTLRIPRGHVWIELVPTNGGSVKVRK